MPYATVDHMTHRFDERLLKELVKDDGVTETNLSSNEPMQVALQDAAGEINAAVRVGKMYDPTTLDDMTGDDMALLRRLNCELAMCHLIERRVWDSRYAAMRDALRKGTETYLDRFRKGERVFNITANINAGLPSSDGLNRAEYDQQRWMRDRYRGFYPNRHLPVGRG